MDSSVTAGTIQALGFATGTILCWLLVALRWKSERRAGTGIFIATWLAGSLWTCGAFVRQMLLLAGLAPMSRVVAIVTVVAWISPCITPTLVTYLVDQELGKPSRSRRLLLGISTLLGGVLVLLLLRAAFLLKSVGAVEQVMRLSGYNFILHAVGWGLSYRVHRKREPVSLTSSSRVFSRATMAWVAIEAITILISMHFYKRYAAAQVTALISQQMILPGAILTAAFLAKSRYADVLLKRSLILVSTVTVATLAVWWIPGLPRGFAVVVASLSGASLLLAVPAFYRVLNRTVDRVFLQRPEYGEMARAFGDESRRSANQHELFALAEKCIEHSLHLAARIVEVTEIGSRGGVIERIPVKGAAGADYALELSPDKLSSAEPRSLMHEEIAFLGSVCTEVTRRLETLEFERQRRELQLREERLQHSLTQAELKALRAQVDPHFLFNTLNTIVDLIATDPRKAESMTERLAEFFRYTLSRTERMLSTVDQELEFARHYLEIEQVRFGERLRVQLSRDPELGREVVPSLILQPLVENAVRHGLASKPEGGSISVSATCEGAYLRLQVADDGVGMRNGGNHGPGIGLQNVRERLRTVYGEAARMDLDSGAAGGTCVRLLLPRHEH